jgi:hypothetical protein
MRPVVKQNWKPILLLIVLAPFLAEVISGDTPLPQFFLPGIFFGYVLSLYGLPVLVIREVAIRWRLGLLGLWCLGLVFGLYCEGLRTESLFYPLHAPMEEFSAYGLVGGVRVPFTLWISAWHGLFSVVTPILFVEYLFPDKARQPWLPLKATWSVAVLSVATGVAYFLFAGDEASTQPSTTLAAHLGFMVVAALVLSVVAGKLPRTPRITANSHGQSFTWSRFWSGALLYMVLGVVPVVLAQSKVPWPLFVLYLAAVATVAGGAVARRREATREQAVVVVLGAGTAQAVLAVVFGVLIGNIMYAASSVLFAALFVTALARIRRKERRSLTAEVGTSDVH